MIVLQVCDKAVFAKTQIFLSDKPKDCIFVHDKINHKTHKSADCLVSVVS